MLRSFEGQSRNSLNYPKALKDLTLTEEYIIAKAHPVRLVVKLRPGGQTSLANYRALRGHFIFAELIKVFWLGNRPLTDSDLQPFFSVRKYKVLAALRYLVQHNDLYRDQAVEDNRDYFTDDALLVTTSVTIDLNRDRQNPDLRLLNTMHTLIDNPPLDMQT
ncbi:hypothetical protein N7467_001569 [Penicillium canescens]|nr:hypothetical protein N7467_001569 [Penicillium canescens]